MRVRDRASGRAVWSAAEESQEEAATCQLLPEAPAEGKVELMAVESRKQYRARWGAVQTGFVDDHRDAVREADRLVADVMEHLAVTFAEERDAWSSGDRRPTRTPSICELPCDVIASSSACSSRSRHAFVDHGRFYAQRRGRS
jgi:hypothetical protein